MNNIGAIEQILCEAHSKLAQVYSVPADGLTIYQAVQFGKMTERMHRMMDKNINYVRSQVKANSY